MYKQWSGPSQEEDPQQEPAEWQEINYKHDVYGRRSEKEVDGFSTRYVYDGPHVIAEYDGNNNLLRKYIYGPGIDQPVCMIEVADSNAVYYYHYDSLGSVVALSDSSGDTVQTYEYSVYGQVAVEDINHPNPYMFAGRRFDIEIGLYYNRARYYNPYTGRFLQRDLIGYKDSMNLYAYCLNNPLNWTDPSGLETFPEPESGKGAKQGSKYYSATGSILILPATWFPSTVTKLEEGWDNVQNMSNLGTLVTIVNIYGGYLTGNIVSIALSVHDLIYSSTFAKGALDQAECLFNNIANQSFNQYGYCAFFEVAIEDKETGEHGTRWVGVTGVQNNGLLKEQLGDHVYDEYEDAQGYRI